MGGPASSTLAEVYMKVREKTAISMTLHLAEVLERLFDDVYCILKHTLLEKIFRHINNLHQSINTIEQDIIQN